MYAGGVTYVFVLLCHVFRIPLVLFEGSTAWLLSFFRLLSITVFIRRVVEQRYGPAERIFCITGLGSRGFFFYSIGFFTCGTVRYAYCIGQDRAVLFVAVRGEPTVAAIVL